LVAEKKDLINSFQSPQLEAKKESTVLLANAKKLASSSDETVLFLQKTFDQHKSIQTDYWL
jgi:hypothetical protein